LRLKEMGEYYPGKGLVESQPDVEDRESGRCQYTPEPQSEIYPDAKQKLREISEMLLEKASKSK
jgi:hypothetical protein